jgi:hypothetical protein
MDDKVFVDYQGRSIRLTAERQSHILSVHPEMSECMGKIGDILT